MKRAFISLYLLLVLSILGIGWGLDRLWDTYRPSHSASLPSEPLLNLMQLVAMQRTVEQTEALIRDIKSLREDLNMPRYESR